MLFLKLSTFLSLVSFNSFPFIGRKHLLILNSELSALKIKVIHSFNNHSCLVWIREICECQASENTLIEVIVEGIRERQAHVAHKRNELLFLDSEWDIFNNNGGWNQFVVVGSSRTLTLACNPQGGILATHLLAVHMVVRHAWWLELHLGVHPDLNIC